MPLSRESTGYTLTIVGAIVALVGIAFGLVIALAFINRAASQTAAIAVLTGLIGPTIVALLALITGERVAKQTNGIGKRVSTLEEQAGLDPFASVGERAGDLPALHDRVEQLEKQKEGEQ